MRAVLLYVCVISILTSLLFVFDKRFAVNDKWRIPEIVLLFFAAAGGAIGGIVSMCLSHHKTQKNIFCKGLPIMMVLQMGILIIMANIFLY